MADTRNVKYTLRQLKRIKTWQLVVLLVLVGFVAATFLRLNNVGMIERRNAVLAADKHGDKAQIAERLYDLQRYSAAHMNASTGVFYLEHQYNRESEAIIQAAADNNRSGGNIYAQADAVCKPRFGGSYSLAYQQCFLAELDKSPPSENPDDKVALPDPSIYRFDFISPLMSLDFAGLATGLCLGILILIIARLAALATLELVLKRRYRDA